LTSTTTTLWADQQPWQNDLLEDRLDEISELAHHIRTDTQLELIAA